MSLGRQGRFSMHSGDSRVLELTVYAADNVTPVDVTGSVSLFALSNKVPRQVTPSGPVLFSIPGVVVDGPNGRIDFELGSGDTAPLADVYYYEIEMVLGGTTSTVAYGTAAILADLIE